MAIYKKKEVISEVEEDFKATRSLSKMNNLLLEKSINKEDRLKFLKNIADEKEGPKRVFNFFNDNLVDEKVDWKKKKVSMDIIGKILNSRN